MHCHSAFRQMLACAASAAMAMSSAAGTPARDTRSVGLQFLENRGQWNTDAQFVGRLPGMIVRATPDALGLQVFDSPEDASKGTYLRLRFDGGSPACVLLPQEPGEANHSWFLGNDPAKWVRGLRSHSSLRWHQVYEGIDFVVRAEQGSLKLDLEVSPGADVSQVRIHCEGLESLDIDAQGMLVLTSAHGCFTQGAPISYECLADGRLSPIPCAYRHIGEHSFGFEVAERDPMAQLWIDPPLQWSTFLGGGGASGGGLEVAFSVCLDRADDVYTCGHAAALAFPTTPGAYDHQSGAGNDCFATKFRGSDGALVYSAVFGGVHIQERAVAIRVDRQGRTVVAGWTFSNDFPSTPGSYDPIFVSLGPVGFVAELSAAGDQLIWSTFLEGTGGPTPTDLALDSDGSPIVVGYCTAGYPTTLGAYDTTANGEFDGFVTKLDPTGSYLEWSTLLGGVFPDYIEAVEIDDQGIVTIAGETQSTNFPTTPGAYSTTYFGSVGQPNLFVARMNSEGTALVWSTLLCGTLTEYLGGLALLPDSGVLITGTTFSQDFPITPGVAGTAFTGGYVARFDPTGSSLLYSTFLGTTGLVDGTDVCVDPTGVATIVGQADAAATMTPGAFDTTSNGNLEVALYRLDPSAAKIRYATYLGGIGEDYPFGVVTTRTGRLSVVGYTRSSNFPTTPGAYDPANDGGADCFVTTFEPYLQGVEPSGEGTPSCHAALVTNATEMPQAGASTFGLYLGGAPSFSRGVCLIATAPSVSGVPFFNTTLWLDPASIMGRVAVFTDSLGFTETALPLTSVASGTQLWAQYLVRNSADCPGGRLAASQALHLTVQ